MNILGVLDWRPVVRRAADPVVVARPLAADHGWSEMIAEGRTVILDAGPEGLRVAGDTAFRDGTGLRIIVPGTGPGEPALEFRAGVVWGRRNPLARFGRFTHGLAFRPAAQPGITALLARCREAVAA